MLAVNHIPWSRRLCSLLTVVAVVLVLVPAQAALAVPDSTPITIDGGGWGHHIGIPHWATQGQAIQGWEYQDILDYWYPGTQVEHVDDVYAPIRSAPDPIRVGIDYVWTGAKQYRPFMWQRFSAVNGDVAICLQGESEGACSHVAQPGETWEFGFRDATGGECYLRRNGVDQGIDPTECETHLYWDDQPNTRVSFPGSDVGRTFARGHVEFVPAVGTVSPYQGWKGFHLVIEMPFEEYLYGLAEVPPSWHLESLKANAVASRSYAVYRTIYNLGRAGCSCDIVWDTTGQWYRGYMAGNSGLTEGDATNGARWRQAVDETADEVRIFVYESSGNRRIAETYFSTISGGATENAWDMWGPDTSSYRNRYAYLGWKPDPWSSLYDGTHSGYPKVTNAVWTKNTTAGAIRNALTESGIRVFDEILSIDIVSLRDSGSPDGIRVVGLKNGSEVVRHYTGNQLQSKLGLVSHFVYDIVGFGGIPETLHDSVGLHDPASGIFKLHLPGSSILQFYYGNPADIPFAGDWNGNGVTTLGLYRVSAGFLFLRNSNSQGNADTAIYYGNPGDLPIAGDWDGDGVETIGIYRASQGRFYLRNTNSQGVADVSLVFGNAGDVPLAGDWNGDDIDTVASYRPSTRTFYFRNSNTTGTADFQYFCSECQPGDKVIVGDWNGDGVDTIGLFRPATATFYLRDDYTGGPDYVFKSGESSLTPISGHWR